MAQLALELKLPYAGEVVGKPAIAVDIDGVLTDFIGCSICDHSDLPNRKYGLCPVKKDVAEALRRLGAKYRIILHTARGEEKRGVTVDWLRKHDIPFDELVLSKPYALYYIDDRAIKFRSWEETVRMLD